MIRRSILTVPALAGWLALSGLAAAAQTATPPERGASTPHIQLRQQRQAARIDQAASAGTLTEREANRLDHQQQHVDTLENKAAADGSVTTQERARVRAAERRASRDIARKTHNDRSPTPAP